MQTTLKSTAFKPSSPLRGDEDYILRGQNMILEGQYPNVYYRAYQGSENIDEPVPTEAITGTITFTTTSFTITGIGTVFLDELHLGQMIQASGGEVIVVKQLLTQTTFTADRYPLAAGTDETATRLPILGNLNVSRFSLLRGNAVQFDKGTILAVGDGELYVNGAVLAGDSLDASRQVQVAVYDSATMTYDVQPVGFEEIPDVVFGDVSVVGSGGTKNMSLGFYSFKVSYYSDITNGFGNPTPTLLSGGTAGYQLTLANSTFEINFTNDVGNRPAKATGYIIYGTAYSGSSEISATNAIQGGWFEVTRVAFADLVGEVATFEYTDSELGTLVSFDNDMPPDAEFISTIDLYPFLISTDGQGVDSTGRETTTSPGAFVAPAKPDNLDGYPASYKVPTGHGETILGVVSAAGRFFVMTPNTLQAVTPTGLPAAPFTCRPFWRRGFANPYNLIFIDDTLYGYSGKKMFRSIATGDTADESYEFATDVEVQLAESSAGYVFIAHDPKNECICVFLSAIRQNDDGYWETDVYPYSLTKSIWMPKVVLTSTERDMVVSGAATVNNELYFVGSGRYPIPCPAEAEAFIAAANITDETQHEAICQLVQDLQDYDIWDKFEAIYPFVGGTADSHSYNLKDPNTYQITWSGGVTHDDNGITGNGSNAYGNTHLDVGNLTTNDTHLSVYSRTEASGLPDQWDDVGWGSGASLILSCSFYGGDGPWFTSEQYSALRRILVANSDARGFFTASRTSSTSLKGYINGALVQTTSTLSVDTLGTGVDIYVLAFNNTGGGIPTPQYYCGRNLALIGIGAALDDTEEANYYTAVQTYQTTLGREV